MFEPSPPGSVATIQGGRVQIARLRLRHARGEHIPASKLRVSPTGAESFSVICFCAKDIPDRTVSPDTKDALRRENAARGRK